MPLKNAVVQGYALVKQPAKPLVHFYGKTPLNIDTLHNWIKFPFKYDNLRFAACFWSFWLSAHFASRKQRALRGEWETNMRIQRKLHPDGTWSEETALPAAKKLGRPEPTHPMRIFEGGYQMCDLKPVLYDPDEAAH